MQFSIFAKSKNFVKMVKFSQNYCEILFLQTFSFLPKFSFSRNFMGIFVNITNKSFNFRREFSQKAKINFQKNVQKNMYEIKTFTLNAYQALLRSIMYLY